MRVQFEFDRTQQYDDELAIRQTFFYSFLIVLFAKLISL